jgi:predicted regulator of Ras-like GTPase activity (Roadblock/LC7/MglB family)
LTQPNAERSRGFDWLLDDLVDRVPAIQQAVVLSADGILTGRSTGLKREEAERMAAIASGFQGLARSAARHFDAGPVHQTVVEMQSAFLFVTAAASGACLAVTADDHADIGTVAYEMAMLVASFGESLATPSRPAQTSINAS